MRNLISLFVALILGATLASCSAPYTATGIKIGEVTDSEAIVWVRLTENEKRVDFGAPRPKISYTFASTGEPIIDMEYRQPDAIPSVVFPDGSSIDTIEGAVPGAEGFVRIHYKPEAGKEFRSTPWHKVDPSADFTQQFRLADLQSGTKYAIEVEYGANKYLGRKTLLGNFRTAPAPDATAPVTFTVITGQCYHDRDSDNGYKIYGQMLNMDPDFFVHTGDILYYDEFAKTAAMANWHWQRIYSLNNVVDFHKNVASYFMKDDHV